MWRLSHPSQGVDQPEDRSIHIAPQLRQSDSDIRETGLTERVGRHALDQLFDERVNRPLRNLKPENTGGHGVNRALHLWSLRSESEQPRLVMRISS